MTTRTATLSLVVSGVLFAAACGARPPPPAAAPETTAGTPGASEFTVSDTFGALRALETAEVEHGTMAMKKATSPKVKAFAKKVVADHEARMRKDDKLMSDLGISPKESLVSSKIKAAGDTQTMKLDSLSGADFDRAYIEEQVEYYRMVLDTFDKELLPNARDPKVRADVEEARARASKHLKEAQDLRPSLIEK